MSCFQFIEEFVKKDPNSIALKQGDKFLTYQALNAKANQFARVISEQSEGKNNIIAVCLDRSFELFVTLLAILKSGNAFLVVDPNGSKHRNEKILCDADPKFIITSEIDSEHLSISHIEKMSNLKSIENLDVEINPFDLAYVVYTSGTTGQPKGVLIEHESLEKLILEKGKILELNAKTCTLQVMSLGFDGFIWEWLSVLSHGGCLKILEIKNSDLISELGKPHHDVTYITAPASLASLLSKDNFMNLQTLLLAGESCSKKLIESWSEVAKVFNCYGPSEATIGCTIFKCDPSYPANTIGKSFQHCEVLVLNAELQLAEINQTGEIYISGDCLARGYLNDSILTAQKFIKISHFNNKTFYQTGDLARYLDDHNIEFIGRADNQVKIRGYRVELSEIESCILSLNYVAQAHCQTYTSEVDTKILASVVLDHSDDSVEHENVKQMINDHLKSELPNYMLPSDIDVCVKFPITNNGKINRQLLLEHYLANKTSISSLHQATQVNVDISTQLLSLISNLLMKELHLDDDFYQAGGHSLLLLQLIYTINETFNLDLQANDLFNKTKISDIVELIQVKKQNNRQNFHAFPTLTKAEGLASDPFPLTEVQQAYWLGKNKAFELSDVSVHGYLEYDCDNLDIDRLELAWNQLIQHHDALRIVIQKDGFQKILENVGKYHFTYINSKGKSAIEREEQYDLLRRRLSNQVFNAENWPLFEIACVESDDNVRLYISIDGVILDAWSGQFIFDQWGKLYQNIKHEIPRHEIKFRDYVLYLESLVDTPLYQKHKEFWLNKANDFPLAPKIPINEISLNQLESNHFGRLSHRWCEKEWLKIKNLSHAQGITPTSFLLSVFSEIMFYWSNQERFAITLTLFNRLPVHRDINLIAGDFTSLILLDIDYSNIMFESFEKRTKAIHLQLWENLEHRLFGGVQFLRHLASKNKQKVSEVTPPIVFTAFLGEDESVTVPSFMKNEVYSITQTPQIWLDFKAYKKGNDLVVDWDYLEEIFPAGMVSEMFEAFISFVNTALLNNSLEGIQVPKLLPKSQFEKIQESNDTQQTLPENLLHEPFYQMAKKYPQQIAIVDGEIEITYQQLEKNALILAQYLHQVIKPGDLVAIMLPKSWLQVCSVLGILAAGGVYLPIDVLLPENRRSLILEKNKIKHVLTLSKFILDDSYYDVESILSDSDDALNLELPQIYTKPTDLAYVILTSGTTGMPKGVMIEHSSAVNTINDINKRFSVTHNDSVFSLSNLSFDLSVYDIFGLLSVGGKIILPKEGERRDPKRWLAYLNRFGITIWNTVPMYMQLLTEHLQATNYQNAYSGNLRLVMLSGDKIPVTLPKQIYHLIDLSNVLRVISLGGATEGSIWSIFYEIEKEKLSFRDRIPYGKPMANQHFYVLNKRNENCPTGVVGELCIGGKGVARGYLYDNELTRKKYFYHSEIEDRLYRTGDIGRYLSDGNIEILGRLDAQVKIQGHRVELGEIEACINQYPEVVSSVVYLPQLNSNFEGILCCVQTSDNNTLKQSSSAVIGVDLNLFQDNPPKNWDGYSIHPYNRKSYKHFVKESIDLENIQKILNVEFGEKCFSSVSLNEEKILLDLLKPLGADLSENIYKHTYPSAGGIYPINIYVYSNQECNKLPKGLYFFDPITNTLKVENKKIINEAMSFNADYVLLFEADLKKVEEKYHQDAIRFVLLEYGHIIGILLDQNVPIDFNNLKIYDTDHRDSWVLSSLDLSISVENEQVLTKELNDLIANIFIFTKGEQGCDWYQFDNVLKQLKYLKSTPFNTQLENNFNYSLLNDANIGILFSQSSDNPEINRKYFVSLGRYAQIIFRNGLLLEKKMGFCPVGGFDPTFLSIIHSVTEGKPVNYGLLGGKIAPCQISARSFSVARDKDIVLKENILKYLEKQLPQYMIPKSISVVSSMPLSQNGKIDVKQLPLPEILSDKNKEYREPKSKTQSQICEIWGQVLGHKRIGLDDNFFQLGGHSLHILQICNQIRKQLDYELSITDAFELPTPYLMAEFIDQRHVTSRKLPMASSLDHGIMPCTHQQKRLWFLDHVLINRAIYNVPVIIKYKGEISLNAAQSAINFLIEKHVSLRTKFELKSNEPVQNISKPGNISCEIQVFENKATSSESQIHYINNYVNEPFDLGKSPLLRACLINCTETNYLVICLHHIIADAWSIRILVNEFVKLYNQYVMGGTAAIQENSYHYHDFSIWQDENLKIETPLFVKQIDYWKNYLSDCPNYLKLPTDFLRPEQELNKGDYIQCLIDHERYKKIKEKGAQLNTTPFNILLAAFHILLHKYSNQDDILIGYPVHNREFEEFENSIGYYANTLTSRIQFSKIGNRFSELVKSLKVDLATAQSHQDVPFDVLVDELIPERQLSYHPIFQVMFVMQDDRFELEKIANVQSEYLPPKQGIAKFDLMLSALPKENDLILEFEYASSLFERETVENLAKCYIELLEQILASDEVHIHDLYLISNKQFSNINGQLNKTDSELPNYNDIISFLQLDIEKKCNQVAIEFGKRNLTYQQINNRSNQLANYFIKKGIEPGNVVSIFLDNSDFMVISVLATLKVGGIYMPIETDLPLDRIQYMIENAESKLMVSLSHSISKLGNDDIASICLDSDWIEIAEESSTFQHQIISKDDTAYILYTSGSTGRPKGVEISHINVINRIHWMQKQLSLTSNDVVMQKTSIGFDVSGWEIFLPLYSGSKMIIPPKGTQRDPFELIKIIKEKSVSTIHFIPTMLSELLKCLADPDDLKSLKHIICSGEALNTSISNHAISLLNANLYNYYGPTETTIDSTFFKCVKLPETKKMPIGRPIDNTKTFILDNELKPVPQGMIGELYIGGIGVGKGYINQPKLTKERFIPNPFDSIEMVYRTGDLVRLNADYQIEYISRIDSQVKLYGQRIELSEIENILLEDSHVKMAKVLLQENTEAQKKLIGFILTDENAQHLNLIENNLISKLMARLPHYMVPYKILALREFPYQINGKLDQNSLLSCLENKRKSEEYVSNIETESPLERKIKNIFSDTFNTGEFSINDNFFHKGIDSITSIRFVSNLKNQGINASVVDVFKYPTTKKLATYLSMNGKVDEKLQTETVNDLNVVVAESFPASSLQKGMIFHSLSHTKSNVYHDVFSYEVSGILDPNLFKQSINHVCAIHPMLRSCFHELHSSEPIVVIHDEMKPYIEYEDLTKRSIDDIEKWKSIWFENEKAKPIQLDAGPLIRFCVHKLCEKKFHFGFSFHHSILDGWSVASMVVEIFQNYFAILKGEKVTSVLPKGKFKDFVQLEMQTIKDPSNKAFWKKHLENYTCVSPKALSFSYPPEKILDIQTYHVEIDSKLYTQLEQIGYTLSVPIRSLFLAIHMRVLTVIYGEYDVCSGYITNTRLEEEGSELIKGLFLNTLPFRMTLLNDENWASLFKSTYERELEVLSHRYYPLANIQKETNISNLFQVVFSFVQFHVYESLQAEELKITKIEVFEKTNYDLMVNFYGRHSSKPAYFDIDYNPKFFTKNQIAELADCYLNVFSDICKNVNSSITGNLLPKNAVFQKTNQFSEENKLEVRYETVRDMFYEVLKLYPDSIALKTDKEQLTYQALDKKIAVYSQALYQLGVRPKSVVCTHFEQSIESVVSLFAIWELGAVYCPLDPFYPIERCKNIISQLGEPIILTDQIGSIKLKDLEHKVILVENLEKETLNTEVDIHAFKPSRGDLAYILFTSGSSGRPKGVQIEHAALLKRIMWFHHHFNLINEDVFSHYTSLSFDVSLEEILAPLTSGASLYIMPSMITHDPKTFIQKLNYHKTTVFECVPSFLEQLLNVEEFKKCRHLRFIIVGGEPLPTEFLRKYQESMNIPLYNLYGPTETTINATCYDCSKLSKEYIGSYVPIGTPIANTDVYLLDQKQNLVVSGAIGEIVIAGEGLARGYLQDAEFEETRFLDWKIPYTNDIRRIYRTGDQGRFLEDGTIEYMGRIDFQLKQNGVRFEAEEIEGLIINSKKISQAVVKQKNVNGNKALICYLKLNDDSHESHFPEILSEIRRLLENNLPRQVIPSYFVLKKQMPLMASGKVDRSSLEFENSELLNVKNLYVPPRNEIEVKLVQIWQSLLNLSKIGVTDNFFSLGGSSFTVTQLIYQIQRISKIEFDTRRFLNNPTIEHLGLLITHGDKNDCQSAEYLKDLKLIELLEINIIQAQPVEKNIRSVFLTGASGYLGIHLLKSLQSNTIDTIQCLVNANSIEEGWQKIERQAKIYNISLQKERMKLILGDIGKERFGLSESSYKNLALEIDDVYHAAARVNHIFSYEILKQSNVLGALEVLKFSGYQKMKKINYVSSLSAFNGSKRLKISEYPVTEIEESIQGGYNQTKWVVEWLYSKAIELGFEITMYRAGTLGVPTTGTIWNQQENHLFRLIMGCVQMGAAPDWQFPIEVMPVDKVSDFIIQSSRATYPSIFNLHETSSFTWHALMLRLQTMFDINIVSHDKWVNEYLTEITKENLLFPLISFYQSGSNIKTDLKDAEFETARFDEAKIKYNLSNFNVTVEEFVKLIMQTNNEFEFV